MLSQYVKKYLFSFFALTVILQNGDIFNSLYGQSNEDFTNSAWLKKINADTSYQHLRQKIVAEYNTAKPGRWGEFVNGVDENLLTDKKYLAFTFDACGGKKGSDYDHELIDYLRKEKIPSTLFVTGKWIDANLDTLKSLASDTLFEIENHGLNHKPCSIHGESEYGIKGTANASDAFDEMEANARKIQAITGRRPLFYRSATAYIDEACTKMAGELGITVISYQVLSGDAIPNTPEDVIVTNVLTTSRPGAIVIMHFNHPKWKTCEAMKKIIPKLKTQGYQFVKLTAFPLSGRPVHKNMKSVSLKSTSIK